MEYAVTENRIHLSLEFSLDHIIKWHESISSARHIRFDAVLNLSQRQGTTSLAGEI